MSSNVNSFFFKLKTAYEMRISDWSSDVCSSDLSRTNFMFPEARHQFHEVAGAVPAVELHCENAVPAVLHRAGRSGEREQIGAARNARAGPRFHRRRADPLVGQPAEQLATPGDLLVPDAGACFGRDVPPGPLGAAGGNEAVDHLVCDPPIKPH